MKTFFFLLPFLLALPLQASAASFSDVTEDTKYRTAIEYLAEKGIINGYGDGRFGPENTLTRAELLKILLETKDGFVKPEAPTEKCFPDVEISAWYAPYVCYAKEAGMVQGFLDGSFLPNAEVALTAAAKIMAKTGMFEPDESTEGQEWYESYVKTLTERYAVPRGVDALGHKLTRQEFSEIIWRVHENETAQEKAEKEGDFITFDYLQSKEKTVDLGEEYEIKNGLVYYDGALAEDVDGKTFRLFHEGYDCGVDKDNIIGFGVPLEPDDDPEVRSWLEKFEEWYPASMPEQDITKLLRKDAYPLTGKLVLKYQMPIEIHKAEGKQAAIDILNGARLCVTALTIKHRGYDDILEIRTEPQFFSYSAWKLFPQWTIRTIHKNGGGFVFLLVPFGDLEYIANILKSHPLILNAYPEKDEPVLPE